MILHIAAPHSNWFQDAMKIYLASPSSGSAIAIKDMRVYLAGAGSGNNNYLYREGEEAIAAALPCYSDGAGGIRRLYVLESFFYMQDWMKPYIAKYWNFMLDSGAFTFMQDKAKPTDWDAYLERYAEYICENSIDLFFELDIDVVVGLKKVEQMRERLERLTGRRSIPVWHKERGLDYWRRMAKEYSYIAIGASGRNEDSRWVRSKQARAVLTAMCAEAHRVNPECRIHGLGYTPISRQDERVGFYSVDSTSWLMGNRAGFIYHFDGSAMQKIMPPEGHRLRDTGRAAAIHNFMQWVKFQRFIETAGGVGNETYSVN